MYHNSIYALSTSLSPSMLSCDSVSHQSGYSGAPCDSPACLGLFVIYTHIFSLGKPKPQQWPVSWHFSWDRQSPWLFVGRVLGFKVLYNMVGTASSLNCSINKVCDDGMFCHKDINSTEEVIGIRTHLAWIQFPARLPPLVLFYTP